MILICFRITWAEITGASAVGETHNSGVLHGLGYAEDLAAKGTRQTLLLHYFMVKYANHFFNDIFLTRTQLTRMHFFMKFSVEH